MRPDPGLARVAFFTLSIATLASAQVNVLSVNYDKHQTGANVQETTLAPGMNWSSFGKLGTFPVDGAVYAQPLSVSGVAIGGSTHNVVYAVTMHNSVYAFNADAPQSATPLWQVNLGASVPIGLFNFTDISPEIGILGTPAIDPQKQVLYVVADTLPAGAFSTPLFQLHALSLIDGHEMFNGPVDITATVPGTGANSTNGSIVFDGFWQLQRPGLMLTNSTLYIGFGSHGDTGYYQGWMMRYDPATLKQLAVLNTVPNGRQGSIWQSGRAPAVDGLGNVIVVTANGDWDGVSNFGESVLHLSGVNLSVLDWYTPQEWSFLNDQDYDLGTTGAILIPGTHYLLAGGKAGRVYLMNYNSLGHLGSDNTSSVQSIQANSFGLFDMALWPNAPNGPLLYEYDPAAGLKAFQVVGNQLNSTIISQFTPASISAYAGISVSSNGGKNGIVWLTTGNDSVNGEPGTLHALDAEDLSKELWNSDQNGTRDQLGSFMKFVPPTVVNGRVYAPTMSDAVVVYGTLVNPQPDATPAISAVVNSASFLAGAVSPGELITIFGANLGPDVDAPGVVNGSVVANTLNNVQVLIGGTAAPILYASDHQINTIVPFGVSGTSTGIQVVYQGELLASTTVQIQDASPAVFSLDGSGGGPGAILNQDGSVSSLNNPASPGSVVALFATGAGVTTPASEDGALIAAPYPAPNLSVSVTINGEKAKVVYAGAAPGLVAGVLQIDVEVPADTPFVPYNQIVVTVGNHSSPSAVTLVVQ